MTHEELIGALEKATGPDRELDAAIIAAAGGKRKLDYWWIGHRFIGRHAPPYTVSIEAALTLAHGWDEVQLWCLWNEALALCSKAEAHIVRDLPRFICIAALRARGGSHG